MHPKKKLQLQLLGFPLWSKPLACMVDTMWLCHTLHWWAFPAGNQRQTKAQLCTVYNLSTIRKGGASPPQKFQFQSVGTFTGGQKRRRLPKLWFLRLVLNEREVGWAQSTLWREIFDLSSSSNLFRLCFEIYFHRRNKIHEGLQRIAGADSRNKAQPINTTSFSSLEVHPEILAWARVTTDAW